MIRIGKTILASGLLLLFAAGGVSATPRDFTMAVVPDTTIACVTQVVSPQAHCAAISDTLGLIAIGNRAVPGKAGEVSIFGLDAQGKIVGQPAPASPAPAPAPAPGGTPAAKPAAPPPPKPLFTITLPRPASLAAFANGALSMAFHPKLPLLYVWQDTTGPPFVHIKDDVVMNGFDHLLIYSVAPGAAPQLVQALGRGPEFGYSYTAGAIALDAAAARIYMPSLRMPESTDTIPVAALGFFKLDAKGLPVRVGDKPDLTLDKMSPYDYFPQGLGYVIISDDVMITAGIFGPITLDRSNRRAHWSHYQLTPMVYYASRLVGHPTLPVVYLSMYGYPYIYRMEHADGFLTLLPQTVTMSGGGLFTPPVVMAKKKQVAFGGSNRVFVVSIDDEGWFTPHMEQMLVANPAIEALVYSEKFDRLYAAVETPPQ